MNQKKVLLFDLDDTIFDFGKGETEAIKYIFDLVGIEKNLENIQLYKKINVSYWEKLERKEMTKNEILVYRFKDLFEQLHVKHDHPEEINRLFLEFLSHQAYYMEDALDTLETLYNKGYKMYLISNGIKHVQEGRLKIRNEFMRFIERCYISDCIGIEKPDPRFIDYILNETHDKKEEMVIIGDSLTSDMKLGLNTGIDTIWFNHHNKQNNGAKPTLEIHKFKELLEIL